MLPDGTSLIIMAVSQIKRWVRVLIRPEGDILQQMHHPNAFSRIIQRQ
jgi:hypothetical protein